MRACLGLLRPQAASIPDIVADSQNILHVMIDVGPRGTALDPAKIPALPLSQKVVAQFINHIEDKASLSSDLSLPSQLFRWFG